jgi:hypothetical protein
MAARTERWDRDRYLYERDRDRYGDERRERFEEHDHVYSRGGAGAGRVRDHSDERHDRRHRQYDNDFVRDRGFYDDEPRFVPRREPPPGDYDRRVAFEKEKEREYVRDVSPPPRRPTMLRRQSSLDTFDRLPRPIDRLYEREEYGQLARREDIRREDIRREEERRDDFRAPAYVPIPLPRTRALPPPRRYVDREYYDEIKIAEPDHYGDEEFRSYPERIREREVVKTRRRRNRSRDSHTTRTYSHRSSSRSSSTSRSSSRSGGTTVKSEYPKKGKTRIPAKLASRRALIDLGYPFLEEVSSILGQLISKRLSR